VVTELITEADVLRTLREGTYTLPALYRRCEARADIARDGGLAPPDAEHPTARVWKRRLRGMLQTLRASGNAERVNRSVWLIRGTPEAPRRLVLVAPGGTLADVELHLADAMDLLRSLEEPADLVLCDPPYALGRGTAACSAERVYRRDRRKIVGGYVDVPSAEYPAFTRRWVSAAAGALRPGGQLAVVTGPQQAAIVQVAAEECGLT